MYYLYAHRRLDKNVIFYIGIGTKKLNSYKTKRTIYNRAYQKTKSRNRHWKNIVEKTDYVVEIILESKYRDEIELQEILFIKKYKNTLCNKTSGGKGLTSFKHTKESKIKIGNAFRGKKLTKEHIIKSNKWKYIPVKIIDIKSKKEKKFNSIKAALLYINKPNGFGNVSNCLKGLRQQAYGYIWEKL